MAFGVSLHRELELLVQAGLSPAEAIAAATGSAAAALRSDDLGTASVGALADLFLVSGSPWTDIADARHRTTISPLGRRRIPAGAARAWRPAGC